MVSFGPYLKKAGNARVQGWAQWEPAFTNAEWEVRLALSKALWHVPRMLAVVPR